ITTSGATPPSQTYAPPPPAQTYAPAAAPGISSVVARPERLGPGQELHVMCYGTPGAQATFDVGHHIGMPMSEGPAGTYRGRYTVSREDHEPRAVITCHLSLNGQTTQAEAPDAVALLGGEGMPGGPGYNGYGNYNNPYPPQGLQLQSINVNTPGPLLPGQHLIVTAIGTPGMTGTLLINGRSIPMTERQSGVYVGDYLVQPADMLTGTAPVDVTLQAPNGQITRLRAPNGVTFLPH
ncbi:MAG: hypothetical protein ACYCW6_04785, partial [Candidatus Xenobia bacterium]